MISDESASDGFKSDGNDTNASDDEESPSKKIKTKRNAVIKLEDDDEMESGKGESEVVLMEETSFA